MKRLIAALLLPTLFASASFAQYALRICGEIDTTSMTRNLIIAKEDPRNPTATFPIENGKFDFVFETGEIDTYYLCSEQDAFELGMWHEFKFFSDNGVLPLCGVIEPGMEPKVLKFELDGDASPMNREYLDFVEATTSEWRKKKEGLYQQLQEMPKEEMLSDAGNALIKQLEALLIEINEHPDSTELLMQRNGLYNKMEAMRGDGSLNSEKYNGIMHRLNAIETDQCLWEIERCSKPDGNEVDIEALRMRLMQHNIPDSVKQEIIEAYSLYYQPRYHDSAIGGRMEHAITGYEVNRIGGRYPDYQLPDADGRMHNISDLIKGKTALIDLWGSTCGSCRVNSQAMIPIYNDFKDKGFTIVGVAREFGGLDRFRAAVEKDGYPWQQLIDLDDAAGIFSMHGIPTAMGGTYLVGPDGRVLLVKPSPQELREYLQKNLPIYQERSEIYRLGDLYISKCNEIACLDSGAEATALLAQRDEIKSELASLIRAYAKKYAGTAEGANIICMYAEGICMGRIDADEIKEMLEPYQGMKDNANVQRVEKLLHNRNAGAEIPDLMLTAPSGPTTSLRGLAANGDYLLVDFWASWCQPCCKEIPGLKEIYAKYHEQGLEIASISLDSSRDSWTRALAAFDMPWPQFSDLKGWDSEAAHAYGINAIPYTLLYGPGGRLIAAGLKGEELSQKLAEIFGHAAR